MTKYSKFNPIYRLQKWLDSVPGQTFMNYAYSWGAAIVIAGALFKLTHLPGANFWLFLGMGTEIFVFFISGFDRPFDKTEDGKDLPTHVHLDDEDADGVTVSHTAVPGGGVISGGVIGGGVIGGGVIGGGAVDGETVNHGGGGVTGGGGGTIVIGGGGGGTTIIGGGGGAAGGGAADGETVSHSGGEGVEPAVGAGGAGVIGGGIIGGVVAPELPELNPDMEEATNNYVEQLKNLTETLQ